MFVFPWPLSPMMTTPSDGNASSARATLRKSRMERRSRSAIRLRPAGTATLARSSRFRSASGEARRALLEKRRHPFLHVVGRREQSEMVRLERQTFVERHPEPAIHRFDTERDRERRVLHDLLNSDQLGGVHHAVHESDTQCFLGVDHLASHEQLQRTALADQAREPLRAAVTWQDAELDFGLTELCVFRGDAYVARHGKLAATAQRESVNRCDDGLGTHLVASENILAGARPALRDER